MAVATYQTSAELQFAMMMQLPEKRSVNVAVWQDGKTAEASRDASFPLEPPVAVGCIAKCLTATLLARTMDELSLGLNDPIGEKLVFASARSRKALADIDIRHLLNHTHGLDDADVGYDAPRLGNGLIDIDLLCSRLAD